MNGFPRVAMLSRSVPTPLWTWHMSEKSALLLVASEIGGWVGICYCSITKLILTNAVTFE